MNSESKDREKFTILVRLRPQIKDDLKTYKQHQLLHSLETFDSSIVLQRKNNQEKTFKFTHVFNPGEQEDIYKKSEHLVDSMFEGYNSTFLAYGQTGTGKTHTVFGGDGSLAQSGYFYKAGRDIFMKIKQRMNTRQFAVRISFAEFYLDNVYDLISNDSKKLQLKQNAQSGIYIKQLSQIPIKSEQQLFQCVRQAIKIRKTEQTSINKRSSRSHAVLQITLLQRWMENKETRYLKGMLKIVDLAGSQRVSKTESNGNRLEQAKRINKEITTLGKCINMLAISEKEGKMLSNHNEITNKFNFNKAYIPFRDAKITRFLSDSLQGKSRIILCVCVSKYLVHIEQTFSSLLFASQASTLKIDTKKNQIYSLGISADKNRTQTPTKGNKSQIRSIYTPLRNSKQPSQHERKRELLYMDHEPLSSKSLVLSKRQEDSQNRPCCLNSELNFKTLIITLKESRSEGLMIWRRVLCDRTCVKSTKFSIFTEIMLLCNMNTKMEKSINFLLEMGTSFEKFDRSIQKQQHMHHLNQSIEQPNYA